MFSVWLLDIWCKEIIILWSTFVLGYTVVTKLARATFLIFGSSKSCSYLFDHNHVTWLWYGCISSWLLHGYIHSWSLDVMNFRWIKNRLSSFINTHIEYFSDIYLFTKKTVLFEGVGLLYSWHNTASNRDKKPEVAENSKPGISHIQTLCLHLCTQNLLYNLLFLLFSIPLVFIENL